MWLAIAFLVFYFYLVTYNGGRGKWLLNKGVPEQKVMGIFRCRFEFLAISIWRLDFWGIFRCRFEFSAISMWRLQFWGIFRCRFEFPTISILRLKFLGIFRCRFEFPTKSKHMKAGILGDFPM